MPPPIKKRLSSAFAFGYDLPGWSTEDSKITDDDLDLEVDGSLLECSSSHLPLRTETPMLGHANANALPQLGLGDTCMTVSKSYKVVSEPLIATPSIALYWESLFGNSSRSISTPLDPRFGQPTNYTACSSRRATPYPNAEPKESVHPHNFDRVNAAPENMDPNDPQRLAFPPLRHVQNATFDYDAYHAPKVQLQSHRHVYAQSSDTSNGSSNYGDEEKCATPSEITRFLPDGRAVKYRRVVEPTSAKYRRPLPLHTQEKLVLQPRPQSTTVYHQGEMERKSAFQPPRRTLATANGSLEPNVGTNLGAFAAPPRTSAFSRPVKTTRRGKAKVGNSKSSFKVLESVNEVRPLPSSDAPEKKASGVSQPLAAEGTAAGGHSQTTPTTKTSATAEGTTSTGGSANDINYQGCICKRSRCLKLYCKCFQTGNFCDSILCKCKDCRNTNEFGGPKGERTKIIRSIQSRRPDAFSIRPIKKSGEGCACKKNR